MSAAVFDPRACELGEGPLWHPERQQLFWFDIIGKRLLSRDGEGEKSWQFQEHVSAAGWLDRDHLLIASETALLRFDLRDGNAEHVVDLEADNPITRSNDGRADPMGGFWIGTMGKSAEAGAGAIYRFYGGKVTRLFNEITIPNAICFSPDGQHAYFTDTPTKRILRQTLDAEGWPVGDPELFLDLGLEGLNPDGAVVDAEGCLWNAQWGASRVARYGTDGRFLSQVEIGAQHASCPAFGGAELQTLFLTSAREGIADAGPSEGQTFSAALDVKGQREHRVRL
ncbi:MAG: SMP-30/gluconolactonase/LRE family protein [Pseudomonadota bacterium]